MRVLWICNRAIPAVSKHLNIKSDNKEGWLAGLSEKMLSNKKDNIVLGICFPVPLEQAEYKGEYEVTAYGFYEDPVHFEIYDERLEERFAKIYDDFKPDVIHIFGTEYGHTLAACRAATDKSRILIGIQGLCSVYSKHYFDGLPDEIINSYTLRDFLKKDNIAAQKNKFEIRGNHEIEALSLAGNITGRTDWDRHYSSEFSPNAKYHFMNETLRTNFYGGRWKFEDCEKYSIFVSQGDYPIKGLHLLLEAMPDILKKYPDTKVYVSGNKVTGEDGLKKRILIGSYGKYLRKLIKRNGLEDKVEFLGSLNAEKMKERYLRSNMYLSPSVMENSPNSVGEAMLLGVPIVSSDVGGVKNLIENGTEGFIYDALDVKALTESVCKMFELNGTDKMTEMTDNAVRHGSITHNGDTNYSRLMEIYEDIVGR